MNSSIQKAKEEGYVFTGAIAKEWEREKLEARLAEYKVMGNKAKILREVEVSKFRDHTSKSVFLCIYVLYSEKYLEFKKNEKEAHEKNRRELALKRMADEMTVEEINFILNYKLNS